MGERVKNTMTLYRYKDGKAVMRYRINGLGFPKAGKIRLFASGTASNDAELVIGQLDTDEFDSIGVHEYPWGEDRDQMIPFHELFNVL